MRLGRVMCLLEALCNLMERWCQGQFIHMAWQAQYLGPTTFLGVHKNVLISFEIRRIP